MRPRRGTELHGRGLFLAWFALGVLALVVNFVRIATESLSTLGVVSAVGFVIVGGYAVWRSGYMLEWWGPPEEG